MWGRQGREGVGAFRCIMESKRGRVGEESNAVVSSVQVKIRTSEANTYVKVGWLPGVEKEEEEEEEEERERERERTRQQQ